MDSPECSLTILLVEDNHDFVFLLSSLLESMGHKCIPAYNGIEGVKKAKEIKPNIIFCDIGLPEMDGFGVVKCLREDDSLKETIFVALTGYAGQREFDQAMESGFNYHLAKPIGMSEIKNILDKVHKQDLKI